jgi:hypothetical protein
MAKKYSVTIDIEVRDSRALRLARIINVLEASSGNVSLETARKLDDADVDTGMQDDMPITYMKGGFGWWVRVSPELVDTPKKTPADLLAVIDFARSQGCEWIMFDRDADPIPGLPTYDW